MADLLKLVWVVVIIALCVAAFLFLVGALSVERVSKDMSACACKQGKIFVYADINCPVHGERS